MIDANSLTTRRERDLMHRKPLTIDAWEGFWTSDFDGRIKSGTGEYGPTVSFHNSKSILFKNLAPDNLTRYHRQTRDRKTMNYNIATILAVIAILFVLLTYITGAPLVPVAVILLGLAILFGGNAFRRV
jgi:hypothetical protein